MEYDHSRISPTALGVAMDRTFTNIPYAKAVFDFLSQQPRSADDRQRFVDQTSNRDMVPMIEARHLLTDKLIEGSGVRSILELAAGFNSRGIAMTTDKNIQYVEVDLRPVVGVKHDMVSQFIKERRIERRDNLQMLVGNVLTMQHLRTATRAFTKGPIAIVTEGLLRYLTFPEKEILARNIHELLKDFGGVWITPDIHTIETLAPRTEANLKRDENIGRALEANLFTDKDHARHFFEGLGFHVEARPMMEMFDSLISPERMGMPREEARTKIGERVTFVMRTLS